MQVYKEKSRLQYYFGISNALSGSIPGVGLGVATTSMQPLQPNSASLSRCAPRRLEAKVQRVYVRAMGGG